MEKKEIQEQRMKGYFIEATKNLLKSEGLRSVSVRNIAEQAGYSYATLYNYFKDVNELVFECVKDFQQECETFIAEEVKTKAVGTARIKEILKAYTKFFVQYPGIFELFFIEKIADGRSKQAQASAEYIRVFPDKLCEKEWNYCIENKIMTAKEAELKKDEIKYMLTGLLLFYINRKYPVSYKAFTETVNNLLSGMLG